MRSQIIHWYKSMHNNGTQVHVYMYYTSAVNRSVDPGRASNAIAIRRATMRLIWICRKEDTSREKKDEGHTLDPVGPRGPLGKDCSRIYARRYIYKAKGLGSLLKHSG